MKLREQDKIRIENIAKQTLQTPLEIWAYGSRVNGDAHDTSDLDLVILTKSKKKLDIDEFMSFKTALQKSNIPILIQVMDWNRIPESFHENILSNYEILI
ncbi:MAG: nucleotidyltransferase domain-containing protein [Campylobacterota bacterium]|nr:nucleotidyltransferase domain-containing protein [Campylobacterota bacterium]